MNQLQNLYNKYTLEASDINEHLPKLKELANECKHVTEMWVRTWLSSVALLMWCDNVISYDLYSNDNIKEIQEICPNWDFRIWSTLEIDIEPTEMLFIDTLHNWEQLRQELSKHSDKVSKYIVFHDTVSFWKNWETSEEWLLKPMKEFLQEHNEWKEFKVYYNNNGLTIWKRKNKPVVTVYTAIFGNYDRLKKQPEQSIDVRYVCFTDSKSLQIEKWAEKQREIRYIDLNSDEYSGLKHLHPRLQAKYFRTHPYEFFKWIVIYMDWTARLKSEKSLEFLSSSHQRWWDIICFKNPERDNILDEALFCQNNTDRFRKYKWLDMISQARHYIDGWFPLENWLNASWFLVMRLNSKLNEMLDARWLENLNFTYQDQISFEPMIRKYNINRQWIDYNLRNNPYISFLEWHKSDA